MCARLHPRTHVVGRWGDGKRPDGRDTQTSFVGTLLPHKLLFPLFFGDENAARAETGGA
jgi:hypothetical protein